MSFAARAVFAAFVTLAVLPSARTANAVSQISVVAAENFYGDVARQIGGEHVAVVSIMSNPDQDPHLFETTPSTVKQIGAAQIVIENGADYDPWMDKLLAANEASGRVAIVVADLVGRKSGDNPHLWYDPATMPAVAKALTAALDKIDPAHAPDFDKRRDAFLDSLKPLDAKVASLRARFSGVVVTATEPVFGYMADAIGLKMRNLEFQMAVMNDSEPTALQVATFENDLRKHTDKVLFYNNQATEDLTKRMQDEANENGVPVVGVSETEPPGTTYQKWMLDQLEALDKALADGAK